MIQLFVNGNEYSLFKEVKITKSLDSLGGSFEFVCANDDLTKFPISVYDEAYATVNGEKIVTGYIPNIEPSYDPRTHDLTIIGYDKAIDVAQCSIFENTQFNGEIPLDEFCKFTLQNNGITDIDVVNRSGVNAFETDSIISAETGKSVFEFLDIYMRKKGVVLNSDGDGNLVIYRNTGFATNVKLENKVGQNSNQYLISSRNAINMENRFSKIIVKSQGGLTGFSELAQFGVKLEDIEGIAEDRDVKRNRVKVIISDSASDINGCKEQATWEVNKRRADSQKYLCQVQGFNAPNGELWKVGQVVSIDDDLADIQSNMLLNSITYNYVLGEGGGSTCDLEFIAHDAYKLQAEDPTANTNKIGSNILGDLTPEQLRAIRGTQ